MIRSLIFEQLLRHLFKENNLPFKLCKNGGNLVYVVDADNTKFFNIEPKENHILCSGGDFKNTFDLNDPELVNAVKEALLDFNTFRGYNSIGSESEIEI